MVKDVRIFKRRCQMTLSVYLAHSGVEIVEDVEDPVWLCEEAVGIIQFDFCCLACSKVVFISASVGKGCQEALWISLEESI